MFRFWSWFLLNDIFCFSFWKTVSRFYRSPNLWWSNQILLFPTFLRRMLTTRPILRLIVPLPLQLIILLFVTYFLYNAFNHRRTLKFWFPMSLYCMINEWYDLVLLVSLFSLSVYWWKSSELPHYLFSTLPNVVLVHLCFDIKCVRIYFSFVLWIAFYLELSNELCIHYQVWYICYFCLWYCF